ncbi:GGDEF domain-containing protein [Paenibacillus sp. BC26]|uniref:sensor domain-containing diguanylate cyclase n=1 Tax=Paenibacillus sp. BC26 TaxID=1881032 RepID=UPI0008EDA95F|nr:GGDEF domain-containing protein [Paenibacillus sp. BC26]SFT21555.1 PAS domain S-box-containing protein/diguanylate cyclase (GGDEF) domain-containing protein [Paenibacillus sp. BC26]
MTTWTGTTTIIGTFAAALLWGRFYYVRMRRAGAQFKALQLEYATLLREQQGITFKIKKIDGRYCYTMADGQLFYRLGLTQADIGKTMEDIFPESMHAYIRSIYDRAWAGEQFQYESELKGYTYLNSVMPIKKEGRTVEVIIVGSDITERKKAEKDTQESEDRYRRLVDLSPDAIMVIGNSKLVLANQKAVQYLGDGSLEKLMERPLPTIVHPDYLTRASKHVQQVLERRDVLRPFESVYLRLDGQPFDVEVTASWMQYNGESAVMVIFRDITQRKLEKRQLQESNKLLSQLAHVDGLTGIANRRFFDDMFDKEWELAVQGELPLSVILCDIDYFKAYNDSYGHQEGDTCLRQVAGVLNRLPLANGGLVARYGGEEFIILLPETNLEDAAAIGGMLGDSMMKLAIPHRASRVSSSVTISVGVAAITPTAWADKEVLVRHADTALYEAKQQGRNQMKVYGSESMVKEGV